MLNTLINAVSTKAFMPHSLCLLKDPFIMMLHVVSDGLIALSYFTIPLALYQFVRRRSDLAFGHVFMLFATFILFCGATHILDIWTLWFPDYFVQGIVKAATAAVSVMTAVMLWPLLKKALTWPSPAHLAAVNEQLTFEIDERRARERTIEQLNEELKVALREKSASEAHYRTMFETVEGVRHSFPTERKQDGLSTDPEHPHFIDEREFHLLAEAVPQIVWVTDPNGKNLFINQQWVDYTGLTLADIQNGGWNIPFHPDDQQPAKEAWLHALETKTPYSLECRLRRTDGVYRWWLVRGLPAYDEDGHIYKWFGTCTDIHDLKEAQERWQALNKELESRVEQRAAEVVSKAKELAVTEERLRLAMKATKDGLWDWNIPAGHFYTDASFKLMLGFGEDDIDDHGVTPWAIERIHPADAEWVMPTAMKLLTEQGQFELEFRVQAKDGQYRWILSRGETAERDANGSPVRVIGTHADITARKEAELALQESEARYRELSDSLEHKVEERTHELSVANAAKSQFLAHMSHELRTPLNAIMGFGQLLAMEPISPDQRDMVQSIHQAGGDLLRIINDLLDLTRIEAGQLILETEPFHLELLLDQLRTMLRYQAADKGVALNIQDFGSTLGTVSGDAKHLKQVLINLVGNAIKFTDQGEVSLTVQRLPTDDASLWLRFEVRDTGIGMSEETIARLFKPFTQGDPSINRRFGGAGLGLVISKQIIEAMSGRMGVSSIVNQGSLFWVELPLNRAEASTKKQEHVNIEPSSQSLRNLRVLCVDDNLANLRMAEQALIYLGAAVTTADSGQAALNLLDEHPLKFDVVLMDIQMPDMDGLSATREIRKNPVLSGLPVIALTAGVTQEECQEALGAGMNNFLAKPVDLKQMCHVLSSYLPKTGSPT